MRRSSATDLEHLTGTTYIGMLLRMYLSILVFKTWCETQDTLCLMTNIAAFEGRQSIYLTPMCGVALSRGAGSPADAMYDKNPFAAVAGC